MGAEADVGQGPALRGPQGRAVLRALRHRAVLPRGRPGLQGRRGPARLRSLPGRPSRPARCAPATSCWSGRRRRGRCVSNAAVAVDPDLTYVRARTTATATCSPRPRVERVLGEGAEIARALPGRDLVGARYEPPFRFLPAAERTAPRATPSCPPTSSRPTTAPASSTPRSPSARTTSASASEQGLTVVNPVRLDGTYDERIGPYAGRWVKDADAGPRRRPARPAAACCAPRRCLHAYPHCWRCGTPLLYYAKPSWYIRTSALRDRLLAANETVDLVPAAHQARALRQVAREQRRLGDLARALLGDAAAGLALRERPRRGASGSFADVEARSGRALPDPHRPYVDEHTWPCEQCGEEMRRVPEVIDVWFDSGSMPFAQRHAPFENQDRFEATFPADYICEAIDQTRGWFYSLLAISTLLFDRAPYETVLCLGHIADPRARRCRSPSATSSTRGRSSPATARTPSAGTTSPPSSRGTATCSRPRPSASRSASSCCSCGTPTASTCCTRTRGTSRRSRSPRSRRRSSTAGCSRA